MTNEQRLSNAYSDLKVKFDNLKRVLNAQKSENDVLRDQVAFYSDPENSEMAAKLLYYEKLLSSRNILNPADVIFKNNYVTMSKYEGLKADRNGLAKKVQKLEAELANLYAAKNKTFNDNETVVWPF